MRSGKQHYAHSLRRLVRTGAIAAFVLSAILSFSPAVSHAVISGVNLTDGALASTTNSFSTVSIKPAPNTLILAWVTSAINTNPDIPTLSGNGLTWEAVPGATVLYGTINSPTYRQTLFRAMGSAPAEGSVTIHFDSAQKACAWTIDQFSGVDVSGTNGSAALVKFVVKASDSAGTAMTIDLAPLANTSNATAGAFSNSETPSKPVKAVTGFTSSPMTGTGSPKISLVSEWAIPGIAAVGVTQDNSAHLGGIAVEIKAGPTPELRSGTDPGNAMLSPGGGATMADSFTFQTTEGASAITNVTVTFAPGSYTGLSRVEITDDSGSTVYGSAIDPGSDTPTITLTTNIIAATMLTAYKIRITPKSAISMPAPPGATYAVTAFISNVSSGYTGSDSGGTTVTIDNLSPGNVTGVTPSLGDRQTPLNWTNPPDADLGSIVVLRKAGSAVADTPVEGATYVVGDTVGTSKVACVVSTPGASCIDTGLVNNTTYHYRFFARDTSGNYSTVSGVAVISATPNVFQPDAMIKLFAEAAGAFVADNSYEATPTAQVKYQGILSGNTAEYSLRFQNDGTGPDALVIRGTGDGSGFTVQYFDEGNGNRTAAVTGTGYTTETLAIGALKDWTVKVTPSAGTTPVPGGTSYNVTVTATSVGDPNKVDRVKATTTSTSANITLLSSADKSSCKPGEEITYTITAGNGAGLTSAPTVEIIDPVPAHTGFKIGGATFDASSALPCVIEYQYPDGSWKSSPVSGGCSAPEGYDYCVTQVKWVIHDMPAGKNFTCYVVVRVK